MSAGDACRRDDGLKTIAGTARITSEIERRSKACTWPLSSDACQREDGLKTTAGGAISFAPPPTPKPSTTSRTGREGCKPAYGTLGQETRRGHWLADTGGLVALQRTDDGGRTMGGIRHWRGSAKYTETGRPTDRHRHTLKKHNLSEN